MVHNGRQGGKCWAGIGLGKQSRWQTAEMFTGYFGLQRLAIMFSMYAIARRYEVSYGIAAYMALSGSRNYYELRSSTYII
jgi:hypothetical protein